MRGGNGSNHAYCLFAVLAILCDGKRDTLRTWKYTYPFRWYACVASVLNIFFTLQNPWSTCPAHVCTLEFISYQLLRHISHSSKHVRPTCRVCVAHLNTSPTNVSNFLAHLNTFPTNVHNILAHLNTLSDQHVPNPCTGRIYRIYIFPHGNIICPSSIVLPLKFAIVCVLHPILRQGFSTARKNKLLQYATSD